MALSADPNFVPLSYLLDEDPVGEVMSVIGERHESGDITASPLPASSWREVYRWRGVSNKDNYLDNKLQRLLSEFLAGSEMRVYRDFYASIDIYDGDTNLLGYSDVLGVTTGDTDFEWFDNVLTRFSFEIEGVEVR